MFSLIYDQNSICKLFFIHLSTLFTIATLKMARNEQIYQSNVRSDCMFQLLSLSLRAQVQDRRTTSFRILKYNPPTAFGYLNFSISL